MPKTNRRAESIKPGTTYGYWKVNGLADKVDYLTCECLNCGKEKAVNVYSLLSGKSRSCGCKSNDIAFETRLRRNPNGEAA